MVVGPVTVDRALGKKVFGTFNRFSKNIKAIVRRKRAQNQSNLTTAKANSSWEKGTHVKLLEDSYDKNKIEKIQSKFTHLIEKDEENILTKKQQGEIYQKGIANYGDTIFDFQSKFPEVEDLINDEITEIVESYYNSHFSIDYIKLYRNYHVPKKMREKSGVYDINWHVDSYAPDATKLFVNLSNVTEEHGPLHVASRADTKSLVDQNFNRNEEGVPGRVVEAKADVTKLTGKAGTATIANSNLCLHRADNPSEGNHRDIAMIVFNPSSKPCTDNWTKELSPGRNFEE
jgi:hypothetical protein